MRKTYTFLFLLGFLAAQAGCRSEEVSLMIKALHPLNEDCEAQTDYTRGKGSLNLQATSAYLLSVVLESVIEGKDVEGASGRLLSSEKENRMVLTEWTRQYFLYGAQGTSRLVFEESEPLAGILEPNAAVELLMPLSMMSPAGANAVRELLWKTGKTEAGAEVVVRFQIHGKMVSSGKKTQTAPMDFPLYVYFGKPLPQCEGVQVLAPVGPCGLHGGQDAFEPMCCELDLNGKKCKNG